MGPQTKVFVVRCVEEECWSDLCRSECSEVGDYVDVYAADKFDMSGDSNDGRVDHHVPEMQSERAWRLEAHDMARRVHGGNSCTLSQSLLLVIQGAPPKLGEVMRFAMREGTVPISEATAREPDLLPLPFCPEHSCRVVPV